MPTIRSLKQPGRSIRIKGSALIWIESYISERYQFVHINEKSFTHVPHSRVPQGSVLGPILFFLYMFPFGYIIRSNSIHFHGYADDTHLSLKPRETNELTKVQAYIKDMTKKRADLSFEAPYDGSAKSSFLFC